MAKMMNTSHSWNCKEILRAICFDDFYSYVHFCLFAVTIYQCGDLADGDCSLCRNLAVTHSQLQCNWCDGQCKYNTFCQNNEPETCPAPQVLHVRSQNTNVLYCIMQNHWIQLTDKLVCIELLKTLINTFVKIFVENFQQKNVHKTFLMLLSVLYVLKRAFSRKVDK